MLDPNASLFALPSPQPQQPGNAPPTGQQPAANLGFAPPQSSAPDPMHTPDFAAQAASGGGSGGGVGSHVGSSIRDMLTAHAKDIMTAVLGGLI
jgi:hypothetical protein